MAGIIDVINDIDAIQAVSNANKKMSAQDIYSDLSGIVSGAGSGSGSGSGNVSAMHGGAGLVTGSAVGGSVSIGPGSAHGGMPGFGSAAFDPLIYAYSDLLTYSITQNPQYFVANHHRLIAEELMRVERGETKRLIITMPPRHGKPVCVSSPILMSDFSTKKLGEININDLVITHKGHSKKVTNIFEQGLLNCVSIKTASGRSFIAAYDHPFMTESGYINAIDLKPAYSLLMSPSNIRKQLYRNIKNRNNLNKTYGFNIVDTDCVDFVDTDLLKSFLDIDIKIFPWIRNHMNDHSHLYENTYDGDLVVSVEKCGKHKCRCLEVEEDHTFLVNDVIVHNSQLASEYFQAWYMGRNPDKQLIFVTYSGDKAVDVGRSVRNQLVDPVFQEIFHSCRISEDAKAAASFTTSRGGKFYALGIGGGLTGRGANLLIIDDPIKSREDAESQLKRDRIVDFFGSVAYTRLMTDDNAIILIMTRWHYDDLVGYALQELQHEGWKVLDLPAIAERQEDFVFDNGDTWHRNEGDALWPEYYSLDRLKSVKQTLKARDWSSLYQQSPQPDEGAMVNIEWFNGVDGKRRFDIKQLPKFEAIYFSCDTAFKEKESNDPSAILVFGEYQNSFYLIHVTNERLAYPKLKQECKDLFKKYRTYSHNGCKAFVVEDKASGQSLIQDLRVDKDFVMPLIAINPENNKILRMDECTGHLEAGIVKLPKRAPWLTDLELQLSRFPYDKHDDMCDALSQFIKWKFKVGKLKKRVRRKRYWK